MDKPNDSIHTTDLLLIGGGHSHLTVIKQLGMKPIPGLRVTLLSKDIHTPYSGMLPGLIAGHYAFDDAHIDLRKLCQSAGIRLYQAEVIDLDLEQQQAICSDRAPIRFDFLSINIGSQPALYDIPGATKIGVAVKPIKLFLDHWQQTTERLKSAAGSQCIAVVGGGAASIEVALACQYQLQQQLGDAARKIECHLICGSEQLLPQYNERTQRYMSERLAERGILVKTGVQVESAEHIEGLQQLQLSNGSTPQYNEVIWAIHAGSPQWPQQTGLDCNQRGFINVNEFLQSSSHSFIFAAGDIINFMPRPLAKSGVYAVRAGQTLSDNLRRAILNQPLKAFRPQQQFLSLLMTGDKQAIASKGQFSVAGKWVWRWKDFIDRSFMKSFQIPAITNSIDSNKANNDVENAMRCGGCGAKVSNSILSRVMAKLEVLSNKDIVLGLDAPDDAAVINPPAGKQWLQTVDYFRAFIDDPYLLGRIATNHCLSDIYAMGGTPHSALAIATIPYGDDKIIEDSLLQLMSGAVDSLNEQQTALIGGHSSEGAELSFGLSVNGTIEADALLTKGQLTEGQQLILTKPVGTGTLLAANMQGQAEGRWIENALQQMLVSNKNAADIIHQHEATACTDITGFGLAGHLAEMLKNNDLCAHLNLSAIPFLEGAVETSQQGWLSSLHPDNFRAAKKVMNPESANQHPLLFDPQTSGGLLAAIPAEQAEACLQALRNNDCPQAAIIGHIEKKQQHTISLN